MKKLNPLSKKAIRKRREVEAMLDDNNPDGMIYPLIQAGLIQPHKDGWIVVDEEWAARMKAVKEAEEDLAKYGNTLARKIAQENQ